MQTPPPVSRHWEAERVAFSAAEHSAKWSASVDASLALKYNALFSLLAMVIPYRKNDTGGSVPSRIYNLLAIGRPIIICLEPDAEAAILVREHDLGWVLQPEDHAARQSGSQPWWPAGRQRKADAAAEIAPRYSRRIALKSYRELISRLLNGQVSGTRPG
jgi:hypothetical protein